MLPHLKPVAERGREQPGAGGGPDQRERPQRHVDRPGVDPLAERQVDAKILHRRIQKLLDRLRQPMDFVDEQHRPLLGVGQIGDHVLGGRQGRAAGDLEADAQVAGDAHGEGRLAQARRTVEEDVPQRFAPFRGRIDRDFQPRVHFPLPDHVLHPLRAQVAVLVLEFRRRLQDRFPWHKHTVYGVRADLDKSKTVCDNGGAVHQGL